MKSSKKLEPLGLSQHFLYNRISDGILLTKVRTKENVQFLEHIIHEMYEKDYKHISMSCKDETNDFGKKVGRFGLKKILEQSKNDVDNFLGIDYEDKPSVGRTDLLEIDRYTMNIWGHYAKGAIASGLGLYVGINGGALPYNEILSLLCLGYGAVNFFEFIRGRRFLKKHSCYYHRPFSKIRVGNSSWHYLDSEVGLRPALSHEYSHFLIDKLFFSKMRSCEGFSVFDEGFAEGVEEIVSRENYNKTSNSAWIEPFLNSHISILCLAYLDIAYRIGVQPSGSTLKIADHFAKGITPENAHKDHDIFHGYGKALFNMLDFKYGHDIYKDVVAGNLRFF